MPGSAPWVSDDGGTAYAIGLDIGGTKIAGGLVAFPAGEVLQRRVIPTGAVRGGGAVLADAVALAESLVAAARECGVRASAVGIGVAELVAPDGAITSAQTIAWRGVAVRDAFTHLGCAVVESDVRAAALAEALLGAGRPYRTFVYVTVGTGISHTLVQDGRPYAGAHGNALVFASAPWSTACPACGATIHPVLEETASGPAIVAHYNRTGAPQAARGEDVLAAAAQGDDAARTVVQTAGAALGVGVGFLVNVLDPEAVVVGGGLGLAGGLYWAAFEQSTRTHIWAETLRDLPILPAALGADAGFIGAAAVGVGGTHLTSTHG